MGAGHRTLHGVELFEGGVSVLVEELLALWGNAGRVKGATQIHGNVHANRAGAGAEGVEYALLGLLLAAGAGVRNGGGDEANPRDQGDRTNM